MSGSQEANVSGDAATLAEAIGLAISSWSWVEIYLSRFFSLVSEMPSVDKAFAVFDTIISFEVRLAICNSLMPLDITDPVELQMWKTMANRLTKLYKKRHQIAHFTFMNRISKKTGQDRLYVAPFLTNSTILNATANLMSAREIEEKRSQFNEAKDILAWFIGEAAFRRGSDELRIQPDPHPVCHLRAKAVQTLAERAPPG